MDDREEAADQEVKATVREQFGRTVAAYAASALHARGVDLERLVELLSPCGNEQVLDVGTATGHTALRLAPRVGHVTGVDMTPAMLQAARSLAAERGVNNICFVEGDAEHLPFNDGQFDLVTCRVCAHHFARVGQAIAEMARVVRPGGRVAVVDNYAPFSPELDHFINTLEALRDPSHVREYTLDEWHVLFQQAQLRVEQEDLGDMDIDVDDWTTRAQTPPAIVAQIHSLLRNSSAEVQMAFSIQRTPPLSFRLKRMILVAHR